jgi:hypothetical protein
VFHEVGLNNGAVRRLTRYGPVVDFPGSSANEVETADDDPISFASGEPYTLALQENSGTEGIFRSGSSSSGNWLWMTPPAGSGAGKPTSTAPPPATAR